MICEGYILLGFTRFVKVQNHLQKIINQGKISFPQTITLTIDSINIANVNLTRIVSRNADMLDIKKQIVGNFVLPQQISELAQLRNEFSNLQRILAQLKAFLIP